MKKASSSHACSPAGEPAQFCQTCGAFMFRFGPKEADRRSTVAEEGPAAALRAPHHGERDFLGGGSAAVLAEMIKRQSSNRFFNRRPHHLHVRPRVLAWMAGLVQRLGYGAATLHLAAGYFDAVLSQFTVAAGQVQLVAFTCLFLAAKMEEKDEKVPAVRDAARLFDEQFGRADVTGCERLVFRVLDYRLNLQTPHAFASFFLSRGVVFAHEMPPDCRLAPPEFALRCELAVMETLRRALSDYALYRFTAVALAAAAVWLARRQLQIGEAWPAALQALTLLSWEAISECVQSLGRHAAPAAARAAAPRGRQAACESGAGSPVSTTEEAGDSP